MKKDNDGDELVMFGQYENAVDASMVKGVLETNGVPCMLTNDVFSSVFPIGFEPFGGVRVMIYKRDMDLARKIMESKPLDFDNDNKEQ